MSDAHTNIEQTNKQTDRKAHYYIDIAIVYSYLVHTLDYLIDEQDLISAQGVKFVKN